MIFDQIDLQKKNENFSKQCAIYIEMIIELAFQASFPIHSYVFNHTNSHFFLRANFLLFVEYWQIFKSFECALLFCRSTLLHSDSIYIVLVLKLDSLPRGIGLRSQWVLKIHLWEPVLYDAMERGFRMRFVRVQYKIRKLH